ncbi:MAG TPA: DNA methyltransferase [Coriobacteriia bacterium]|nr:DNA methyltransferase [Coriobacteriia bacterium]
MTVSTTEARARAQSFSNEWADETNERAESQSFWEHFFRIFDLERRHFARFENRVQYLDGGNGYIDVFWPGVLLCEQKSAGRSLEVAFGQALTYAQTLPPDQVPGHIVVSDFANMKVYDLDAGKMREFPLGELADNIELFDFIRLGDTSLRWDDEQAEASVQACGTLAELHDRIEAAGYRGHKLEVFMVRLLFCFFAEDTGIFASRQFSRYVLEHSESSGADMGSVIGSIFEVLDTPESERMTTLREDLRTLPYVNGGVFSERIPNVDFDAEMRLAFWECARLNWSDIAPSIFGSIFQGVMDSGQRRAEGAHYTSEENIRKLIGPLFLDDLYAEFVAIKNDKYKLKRFHTNLANLRFLDPACGSGNFLTTAYKELRHLEDQVLEILWNGQTVLDVGVLVKVNVGQFYGIELLEFPSQIARVAIWLADHQANRRTGALFGTFYRNLPLKEYGHIIQSNALTMDWADLIQPADCSYIMGNPPFIGARYQTPEQKAEMASVFAGVRNWGDIDYVGAWYMKAAKYVQGVSTRCAFVSTNSICQGEQVANLWAPLMKGLGVHIDFAHRTFRWSSEARGTAHVYCVIVGFSTTKRAPSRTLFSYSTPDAQPVDASVAHINAYLVDAPDVFIYKRSRPLCNVPPMGIGNKPIDDGNYLFTEDEKDAFLQIEPEAAPYFHPWLGSKEFINGFTRWCLWLGDCPPQVLRSMPACLARVAAVREFRLASRSAVTRALADTPTRFHVENFPAGDSILVPKVSSERREYVPIGIVGPETFCSDLVFLVPNGTLFHFAVLTSEFHNAWMRHVAGRLESRYRYSAGVVYNTFPWPNVEETRISNIEQAAGEILAVRALYPESTLADLYDPLTMPASLRRAHRTLDLEIENAYGVAFHGDETKIVAHLFDIYAQLAK